MLAPILIFVALDITSQAFHASPVRHATAVALAFLPTIARLLTIKLSTFMPPANYAVALTTPGGSLPEVLVTQALGNGFILTAMLWGAFLAELIDRKLRRAAVYVLILAGFSLFGIVHSATADGNMYLPWTLSASDSRIPYQFTAAYLALALVFLALSVRNPQLEATHRQ